MIKPPIGELLKKTGTRYALVILASKRARQFGGDTELAYSYDEAILKAVEEIADGKVKCSSYVGDAQAEMLSRKARAADFGHIQPDAGRFS